MSQQEKCKCQTQRYEAGAGPHTSMGIQLLHHGQVCVLLAAFLVQHDLCGHAHAA